MIRHSLGILSENEREYLGPDLAELGLCLADGKQDFTKSEIPPYFRRDFFLKEP